MQPITPRLLACMGILAALGCAGRTPVDRAESARAETLGSPVTVRILAVNDFHGQLTPGRVLEDRPVGSAPVVSGYLKRAAAGGPAILVHAGDLVGASPPESALLQDEPTIQWWNSLANAHCGANRRLDPRCNLVGIPGNHEFDEGLSELLRLLGGGTHSAGPFLEDPYSGAHYPTVCANLLDAKSRTPVLPPYVIKEVQGVRLGFIGAVVKDLPHLVNPAGIEGMVVIDEAAAVNQASHDLQSQGVEALVAVVHQGGVQPPYGGQTQADAPQLEGEIVDLVASLDDSIDLVISGHTHEFTNALVANRRGRPILVTQAWAKGAGYAEIDLAIDRESGDVVAESARIVPTWADSGPAPPPDSAAQALLAAARRRTAPLTERRIAEAAAPLTRFTTAAGESVLGDLIADAVRTALQTDVALINSGGIRSDLEAGPITWGELFAVQPFGNALVSLRLSGDQLYRLLNQQWAGQPEPRFLQVSGLDYDWDERRAPEDRIVEVRRNGSPIDRAALYSVATNAFLAGGGDRFTVFTEGRDPVVGPGDLDALVHYLEALPQPVTAPSTGRIRKVAP